VPLAPHPRSGLTLRHGSWALGALAGIIAGVMAGTAAEPAPSGIVPTERMSVAIDPGPEPDLTVFASGEALGKIEPCG